MNYLILIIVAILIAGGLFTLPISDSKSDVYFDVTVENNFLNNPKITYVEATSQKSTLLPSTYSMASFYKSGDLEVVTKVGDQSISKNIGTLPIITVPLNTKDRTIHYKVPGVSNMVETYTVILYENGREIDRMEGHI